MPMAQALVMVRHKVELEMEPQGVLSPMRAPLGPQLDTSLITSSVRKRKAEPPQEAGVDGEAKKGRAEEPLRRVSYGLAETGPLLPEAASPAQLQSPQLQQRGQRPQQAGEEEAECDAHCAAHPADLQQQHGGEGHGAVGLHLLPGMHHPHGPHPQQQPAKGGLLGTLFSPVFHLLHKEGAEGNSGAEQAQQAATLCTAGPGVENAMPLRPYTPPPEAPADCEPADCHVRLLSPLASPKPAARCSAAAADAEDAGPAVAAVAAPPPMQQLALPAPQQAAAAAQHLQQQQQQAAAVEEESSCDEEYELEFDPLLFIKRLPPLEQCIPARRTSFLLPRQTRRSKRKTLVLDLDETLVHSTLDTGFCRPDFTFPVEVGSVKHLVSVRQRPHLRTFLERVARLFEVVVFTASQRVYAEQLLNVIDGQRTLIRHRLFRESCVFWEGNYLKDLTVLGRDLRDTVIVDNSPQAFGFQLDNGIPIESWYDDDHDEELLRLLPFLEQLALADDVRPAIASQFKLRALVNATPDPPQPRGRGCLAGLGAVLGASGAAAGGGS